MSLFKNLDLLWDSNYLSNYLNTGRFILASDRGWEVDENGEYFLSLDFPGYSKEEVKISESDDQDIIIITAENEKRGKKVFKTNIPPRVKEISAKLDNGVLIVNAIPFKKEVKLIEIK